MTPSDKLNKKSIKLSEGVLIAFLTGIAYLYIYFYELGYLRYFNIPENYIRIGLEQILVHSIMFFFIGLSLFLIVRATAIFFRFFVLKPKREVEVNPQFIDDAIKIGIIVGLTSLIAGLYIYTYIATKSTLFLAIAVFLLSFGITAILTWNLQAKRKRDYVRKSNNESKDDEQNTILISLFSYEFRLNYLDSIVLVTAIICIMFFAFAFGRRSAQEKEKYFVINGNPELVVLQSYGETLVCAPFDRETNIVEVKFTTVEIKEELGLFASYEHIGQLTPAEISVPAEEAEALQEEQEPPG